MVIRRALATSFSRLADALRPIQLTSQEQEEERAELVARVAELEGDRAALIAVVRAFVESTCGTAGTVTHMPWGVSRVFSALPEALRNEVLNA
jgi:hypothetical protein